MTTRTLVNGVFVVTEGTQLNVSPLKKGIAESDRKPVPELKLVQVPPAVPAAIPAAIPLTPLKETITPSIVTAIPLTSDNTSSLEI